MGLPWLALVRSNFFKISREVSRLSSGFKSGEISEKYSEVLHHFICIIFTYCRTCSQPFKLQDSFISISGSIERFAFFTYR